MSHADLARALFALFVAAGFGFIVGHLAAQRECDRWIERYRRLYEQALREADLAQESLRVVLGKEPRE